MSTTTIVILGILGFGLLGIIGYFIMIYNGLISLKENIKKSWSNIDVILKQRYDEIPKLISVCESYAQFEKGMLDRLLKARERYVRADGVKEKSKASNQISEALRSVFALAENYPELKANENFMQLQNRISHLEETLADRREFFNDSVNNYNIRIQQIPDVFVAGMLNYQQEEMFEVAEEERRDVKVNIKLPSFD
ncbi:Conserved LemA domain protein [Nitrospina gracilis 3/211]|uniref:Conserved LemA domain protein n=1 Tax=Nitrospina gracilis (strain 3/211) TaxID=1266370 RepID=M1Z1C4_NITG3|nr:MULTISPECIES: LemA family protein [Nitrospina]MCF8724158.1 LemA protein [Nitrospina sp. Nb-3]CCQ91304.1 Conserved LemA domain protein [Nitrospina gracilis 3/211]